MYKQFLLCNETLQLLVRCYICTFLISWNNKQCCTVSEYLQMILILFSQNYLKKFSNFYLTQEQHILWFGCKFVLFIEIILKFAISYWYSLIYFNTILNAFVTSSWEMFSLVLIEQNLGFVSLIHFYLLPCSAPPQKSGMQVLF